MSEEVVEDQVITEIKSVNGIAPIHEAQRLSYLKALWNLRPRIAYQFF